MKIKLFLATLICSVFIGAYLVITNIQGFDGFDTPFGHSTQAFGLLNPAPLRTQPKPQATQPKHPKIAYSADVDVKDGMPESIWINTGQCVTGTSSMNDPGFLMRFDDFLEIFGCRLIRLQGIEYHVTNPEIIREMHELGALDTYYDTANIDHVLATFLSISIGGAEKLFRQWAIDREADANWYFVQARGSFEGYENRGELASYIKKWRRGAEVRIVLYEKRRD